MNRDAATLARLMVEASAAADEALLTTCLARDVRLRALLPNGPEEHQGRAQVSDRMLRWTPRDGPVDVVRLDVAPFVDRLQVSACLRLTRPGGAALQQQHAFVDVASEGIAAIDLICSGVVPVPQRRGTVHLYDAGTLGCSDGLPRQFRRRIGAIPVGDRLEVTARDPAAREDLPALARMMGHDVISAEATPEGSLVLTVERGR